MPCSFLIPSYIVVVDVVIHIVVKCIYNIVNW